MNNLDAFNPTVLAGFIQDTLDPSHIGRGICNSRLEKELTYGHTVEIPRVNNLVAKDYVDATGVTPQDATPGKDPLVVNIWKEVTFDVSRKDRIQNKISTAKEYARRASEALKLALDERILQEAQNAKTVNAFGAVNAGSIVKLFVQAGEILRSQSVPETDWFAVLRPKEFSILQALRVDKGFSTADAVIKNGKVGEFLDFQIYVSNQVYADGTDAYLMFGKKGATDLVVQAEPTIQRTDRVSATGKTQIGDRFITDLLAGVKTTEQGAKMLVTQKVTK